MNESRREMVRRLLRNKMVPAFLSLLLGVTLMIAQRSALDLLVVISGVLLLAAAVGFVVQFFRSPFRDSGLQISAAVICLLVGILLVSQPRLIVNMFPTLMGMALIFNGLSNMVCIWAYPGNIILNWLLSLLVVLFGFLLVTHPGFMANSMVLYAGIFYFVNGVVDLLMLHRLKEELLER